MVQAQSGGHDIFVANRVWGGMGGEMFSFGLWGVLGKNNLWGTGGKNSGKAFFVAAGGGGRKKIAFFISFFCWGVRVKIK